MYDKDEIKNSLSVQDVEELVRHLGGEAMWRRDALVCSTICHNRPGEGSLKLYYYDNTKLFKCYTGCGEYFDIYELVARAKYVQDEVEMNAGQSIRFVANFFGITATRDFDDMFETRSELLERLKKIDKPAETPQATYEPKIYDDSILKNLMKIYPKSWIDEGITVPTMMKYGIKYYPVGERIVIPHYNENGQLIGIRGRALVKEEAETYGKYSPIRMCGKMYNHPLSVALYGLNENKENIKRVKKAIVFEGEKSVLMFDSLFGSENNISVACCGSSISLRQIHLLLDLGVEEIIIAFDKEFKEVGDEEFKKNTKKLTQLSQRITKPVKAGIVFDKFNILDLKQSPIDKGLETFMFLYQNRIHLES